MKRIPRSEGSKGVPGEWHLFALEPESRRG
jgi:hypothetical protein